MQSPGPLVSVPHPLDAVYIPGEGTFPSPSTMQRRRRTTRIKWYSMLLIGRWQQRWCCLPLFFSPWVGFIIYTSYTTPIILYTLFRCAMGKYMRNINAIQRINERLSVKRFLFWRTAVPRDNWIALLSTRETASSPSYDVAEINIYYMEIGFWRCGISSSIACDGQT